MIAKGQQIPVVLLTGFLGAGKTTLLSRWLKSPQLKGAMVIVNELGEVGLDHALLETATDAPLLLENGCACCAASDDLASTLERLFWDRLHGRIPRFEWVLIETTGIADPGPIVELIRSHQLIGDRFRVAGVVTAFDALRGAERLKSFPECRSQLELASVVIITKTDLVGPDAVEAARDIIDRSAPGAVVLTSKSGDLDTGKLLAALGEATVQDNPNTCSEGHEHCDGEHHHGRDTVVVGKAQHKEGVNSAFLELARPIAWNVLQKALPGFLAANARTLLRLKGSVRLADGEGYVAVQAMPGEPITRQPMPIGPGALSYRTGLTIIAHEIAAAELARDLGARIAAAAPEANLMPEQS